MSVRILSIESSCDDTSASVLVNGKVVSNTIANQTVHEDFGGVVPELASRDHQKNIVPVVDKALSDANVAKTMLSAVAITQGPGLLGSLLVGTSFAKSMAYALSIPLIGVNHMQAHVLAHFINDPKPEFPFLCLTISGGHTQLVVVNDYLSMNVVGQSLDDAIGEAFDKGAKMLDLPYPGGPVIDRLGREGDPDRFSFPESDVPGLDFSFSGVKTALLYFIRDHVKNDPDFVTKNLRDITASYQATLTKMLINKVKKVLKEYKLKGIAIAGGVAANTYIRAQITDLGRDYSLPVYIPKFEYCTDNAAMIAQSAYYLYLENRFIGLDAIPLPRMPLE